MVVKGVKMQQDKGEFFGEEFVLHQHKGWQRFCKNKASDASVTADLQNFDKRFSEAQQLRGEFPEYALVALRRCLEILVKCLLPKHSSTWDDATITWDDFVGPWDGLPPHVFENLDAGINELNEHLEKEMGDQMGAFTKGLTAIKILGNEGAHEQLESIFTEIGIDEQRSVDVAIVVFLRFFSGLAGETVNAECEGDIQKIISAGDRKKDKRKKNKKLYNEAGPVISTNP